MCGIAGIFGGDPSDAGDAVSRMLAELAHRGPDDEGVWQEAEACLGQRRLSVIDTSPSGRQPMQSACGRYVLVVNGEIYNYRDLRKDLEGQGFSAWRGSSDSEVLLELIAHGGVSAALQKAKGMFALALWDRRERTAYLARDRMGEKPLYYTASPSGLAFASELTSLDQRPGASTALSRSALAAYLRYGYTPAPLSIRADVLKLQPGGLLAWRQGTGADVGAYWSLADTIAAGARNRFADEEEAADALDALLERVVARQMISDVPLGSFLSGGVDSSLVTAVMQSQSSRPVRTFTLGFDAAEYDEAPHAAAVAAYLGAEHTEYRVTVADALAVAPGMGALYDEPFADASQIPTCMISRMARQDVTVALTGDGGDEMFGGYVRYTGVPRLWAAMRHIPARRSLAAVIQNAPLPLLEALFAPLGGVGREYASRGLLAPNVRRVAGWFRAASRDNLFEAAMTFWPQPALARGVQGEVPVSWRPPAPEFDNDIEPMLWRDTVDYLPGDILCKVDRAAMAVGLETRAPFLDVDIIEFAWRTPPAMKVHGKQTKRLLRRVLERRVPSQLIDRPKLGFSPPLHSWLTGALRDWAGDLLSPDRLRGQGLVDEKRVSAAWRRLQGGDTAAAQPVWAVLMFQSWLDARGGA